MVKSCDLLSDALLSDSVAARFSSNFVHFLSSGPVVAMELVGDEAVSVWKKFLGPAEPTAAQREAPQSARTQLAADGVGTFGHGSDSLAAAARVRKHSTQSKYPVW